MSAEPIQNRFDFPHPNRKERSLMLRIIDLMLDGRRRSKVEICEALGVPPSTEIGARIRDARKADKGAWPFDTYEFNDSRLEGPDEADGVYRWQLRRVPPQVTDQMQGRAI